MDYAAPSSETAPENSSASSENGPNLESTGSGSGRRITTFEDIFQLANDVDEERPEPARSTIADANPLPVGEFTSTATNGSSVGDNESTSSLQPQINLESDLESSNLRSAQISRGTVGPATYPEEDRIDGRIS
ncbi:hypothetical protein RUND412_002496 [Rhizina undulata]